MKKPPKAVKVPKPTNRRQFIAWLEFELRQRGAILPTERNFVDMQRAVEQILLAEPVKA